MAAAQGGLEIAQHHIDPVKLRFPDRGATATADDSLMGASGFGDSVETIQAVGDHLGAGGQMLSGPSGNLLFTEPLDHRVSMTVLCCI